MTDRKPNRGDGLRMKLTAIPGVTQGDAAKALRTAYYFQCPPLDTLQRQWAFTHNKYTSYKGDEYSTRGGKQLAPMTFRTVVVEWGAFVVEFDFDVEKLVNTLARVADAGWPCHLLMTHQYGAEAQFDADVVLENVTATENADEPDAQYLDLSFSRWRDPIANRRSSTNQYPITITLHKNGSYTSSFMTGKAPLTFATIAQTIYGRPSLASYIAASQRPILGRWGMHTDLFKNPRYRKGGKIQVPAPPDPGEMYVTAIVNQPTTRG